MRTVSTPFIATATFLILHNVRALPFSARATGINVTGVTVSQSLYQAAALGAITIGAVAHKTLRNTGFTLSSKRSTDQWTQGCLLFLIAIWVSLVGISMTVGDDKPCRHSVSACLDRASHMPWVLIGYALCFSVAQIPGLRIWNYPVRSPKYGNWGAGLSIGGHIVLYGPIVFGFGAGGYGNWQESNYLPAVLNMTALAMMALEVFGTNPYSELPDRANGCVVLFNTADAQVAGVFVATSTVPHLHTTLG
jgi:hypothetical protein